MRTISMATTLRGVLAGAVLTLGALVALELAGAPALAFTGAAPSVAAAKNPAAKTPGGKFADRLPSTLHVLPGAR